MKKSLFYTSGILTLLWGIGHLIPTAGTIENFGDISPDNKLIITMEWLVEGFTLIFLGILIVVITYTETGTRLARNVFILITGMLISMAILSVFTGFRVNFLPFKLCPVIFSLSALLIILGMTIKLKPENKI